MLEEIKNWEDDGEIGLSARTKINNNFAILDARYATIVRSDDALSSLDFEKIGEEGNAYVTLGVGKEFNVNNNFIVDTVGSATISNFLKLGAIEPGTLKKITDGNSKAIEYDSTTSTGGYKPGHIFKLDGVTKVHFPKNGNVVIESGLSSNIAFSNRADSSLYVRDTGSGGVRIYNSGDATLDFGCWIESNNIRNSAQIRSVRDGASYRTDLIISTSDSTPNNLIDFAYFSNNQRLGISVVAPTEKIDVLGNIKVSGVYKVGGASGITTSGAFTNLTIVGGIITAAS